MQTFSDIFNAETVQSIFVKEAALPLIPAVVGFGGKLLGALGLKGLGAGGAKALAGKALSATMYGSAAHNMLRGTPSQKSFRQISKINPRAVNSFSGLTTAQRDLASPFS